MTELIVLYDNRAEGECRPGFGYSVLIRTEAHDVLFDCGADAMVLEHNARCLGIDLKAVQGLVLSHDHCDHTGALSAVLHRGLELFVPRAAVRHYATVRKDGITLHGVRRPERIAPGIHSVGQMGRQIPEQALILDGKRGPVLLTGCAHAGIGRWATRASERAGAPLALVIGGFHLYKSSADEIDREIRTLKHLRVKQVCPGHCTGDVGIAAFREAFDADCLDFHVGSRFTI